MHDAFYLLAGVFCAGVGGELFVRGTIAIAGTMRIPRGIVAATIAAFATSAPELSVSITSALSGNPSLGVGDALGSNVANIALVAGLAMLFGATISRDQSSKRYITTALYAPLITTLVILDGELSRIESAFLLATFVIWLLLTVRDVRRDRSSLPQSQVGTPLWRSIFNLLGGLPLLILAGSLVVEGGAGIAHHFGLSDFVVGATVVAVGTSMPEIAVVIISRFKNMDEVGLGTLIGSNIFNGLAILPIATLISPLQIQSTTIFISLAFGFASVIIVSLPPSWLPSRSRGIVLLALYALNVLVVSFAG